MASNADFMEKQYVKEFCMEKLHDTWESLEITIDRIVEMPNAVDLFRHRRYDSSMAWHEFEKMHCEQISLIEKAGATPSSETLLEYDSTLNMYNQIMGLITGDFNTAIPKPPPVKSEIHLETFTWKPTDWVEWQANFKEQVMNSNIPPSQKLELLLGAMDDGAKKIKEKDGIVSVKVKDKLTSENRYDEVYSHIFNITIPAISKESYYLDHRVNQVEDDLQWLVDHKVMRTNDDWNAILCVILEQKLDLETRSEWNRRVRRSKIPDVKELFKFLSCRARVPEYDFLVKKYKGGASNHPCVASISSTAARSPRTKRVKPSGTASTTPDNENDQ